MTIKTLLASSLLCLGAASYSLAAFSALRIVCERADAPGDVRIKITGHVLSEKERLKVDGIKGLDTLHIEVENKGAAKEYQEASENLIETLLNKNDKLTRDQIKLTRDALKLPNPYYFEGSGADEFCQFPVGMSAANKGFDPERPITRQWVSFASVTVNDTAIEYKTEDERREPANQAGKGKAKDSTVSQALVINRDDPSKSRFFMRSYDQLGFRVDKAKAILVNCEISDFNFFQRLAQEMEEELAAE